MSLIIFKSFKSKTCSRLYIKGVSVCGIVSWNYLLPWLHINTLLIRYEEQYYQSIVLLEGCSRKILFFFESFNWKKEDVSRSRLWNFWVLKIVYINQWLAPFLIYFHSVAVSFKDNNDKHRICSVKQYKSDSLYTEQLACSPTSSYSYIIKKHFKLEPPFNQTKCLVPEGVWFRGGSL